MVKQVDYETIVQYVKDKLILRYEESHSDVKVVRSVDIQQANIPYSEWLVTSVNSKKPAKKEVPVTTDDGFEELWQAYPPSASFSYKGMKFVSSRVLRSNKQVCQMLYNKGIRENGVTGEEILVSLKKLKKLAMDESYESGQNKLEYWPGFEVWLRQARYMAMIHTGDEDEPTNNSYENYSA